MRRTAPVVPLPFVVGCIGSGGGGGDGGGDSGGVGGGVGGAICDRRRSRCFVLSPLDASGEVGGVCD